jgi:hypothetical protein
LNTRGLSTLTTVVKEYLSKQTENENYEEQAKTEWWWWGWGVKREISEAWNEFRDNINKR